tara:strand:+ start:445 stop:1131 length:687 start_codon:yes stop_codon:yes gene_type:complete
MSLILGIETATKMCSVALSDENGLLALKEVGGEYSHAENLNSFIADICIEAGKELSDVDAVAVSKGPGSYTGLRIGVSAAKGFCFSLNIPLISVDTLQAMAKNPSREIERGVLFCPMIDARRMEVYTALYDGEGNKTEDISAKIIDENSFANELKVSKIVFFGDGAEKCRTVLESNPNAIFIEDVYPSAKHVNELALEKYKRKEFEDLAYFEPFYLKDFIATTPKKLL